MAAVVWFVLAAALGGVGLMCVVVALRGVFLPDPSRRFLGFRDLIARLIEWRLGGYENVWVEPDQALPDSVESPRSVAVIGAGIAGMSAATALGERGVNVDLYDANTYLGGKLGSWSVSFSDGSEAVVDHGFHAWFGQYYNFNRFLQRLGLRENFEVVSEYAVVKDDGTKSSFKDIETTPALNLVDLALKGVYDWRAIVKDPVASKRMEHLLRYELDPTFEEWDHISFSEFIASAKLSPELAVIFTSFTRAFFADPDRMSMAELIKSFHYYYLSTDRGLNFEYPVEDYHHCILEPWRKYMESQGVTVHLSHPIQRVKVVEGAFEVDGTRYDDVILACHIPGVRSIFELSKELSEAAPTTRDQIAQCRAGQRYAVLRLWLTKDIREGLPMFTVTHRRDILDSVTTYHRYEKASQAWVAEQGGGSVIELHCYSLPDEGDESEIRTRLIRDMFAFFPELQGTEIVREVMQVRQDFPAFHTGLFESRPSVTTELDGLYFAGDWVKLEVPAMLMEAAHCSGILAANAVLARAGVKGHALTRVPLKGLLADVPRTDLEPAATL